MSEDSDSDASTDTAGEGHGARPSESSFREWAACSSDVGVGEPFPNGTVTKGAPLCNNHWSCELNSAVAFPVHR